MRKTTHEIEGGRKLYLYSFEGNPAAERQRRFWNAVGEAWRTDSAAIEAWAEPMTRAIHAKIGDRPGLALDVGCGCGSMPLPPSWRVFGVDPAVEMLQPGRAVNGDPAAMPFQDASFDAVVSRLAIMLAPDPVAAFKEVRRVLRMGGTFTFVVWAERDANRWSSAVEDILKAELSIRDPLPTEPSAYRLASPTEVGELIAASNLRLLSSEQVSVPYFANQTPEATFDFMLKFIGPVRTMFEKLSHDRKEPIRSRIVSELGEVSRTGLIWVHHAEREVRFD